MIKIFITCETYETAGDKLTEMFEEWKASFTNGVHILGFDTNSSSRGWSLTIHYNPIPMKR